MRSSYWKVASLLGFACLGFSLAANQPGESPVGRYQATVIKDGLPETALFVIDTTTGQCWKNDWVRMEIGKGTGKGTWTDLGSPAKGR